MSTNEGLADRQVREHFFVALFVAPWNSGSDLSRGPMQPNVLRMVWALASAWLVLAASSAAAAPPIVENESFTIPLPEGYRDITDQIRKAGFPRRQVSLQAIAPGKDDQPTIVFQLAPIWGGTMGNLGMCEISAKSFATAQGKVKSAEIISLPSGKVCQMHLLRPEGIALMTELTSTTETWLMTCNHADGDATAEKACRATLAGFKFKAARPVRPKFDIVHTGVRECDDYLDRYVACLSLRLGQPEVVPFAALIKLIAKGWRWSAQTPDGRASLPSICTSALAQTKSLTRTVGCEW